MTSVMREMDELRLAVGQVEALAAVLLEFFEDPDAALLRMFKRNKQVLSRSDEDVIAAMAHRG